MPAEPTDNSNAAAAARSAPSDAELLRQFTRRRDEGAFRALVERHGQLVLGVATRVLHDRQLAEDVFQAVFLVLARQASRIKRRGSLACWLHGVTQRIAWRSLRQRYRRGERPLVGEPVMNASPLEQVGSVWEQQVLDEELERLPESWREPLILHELEGLSCQATADRLGLSLTALEGRLKRGRKELKHRLLRRGIGAGAVLATLQAVQSAAAAQPAVGLIAATVTAGVQSLSGTATTAAGSTATASHQLATQELLAMTTIKTSALTALAGTALVAATLFGGGWGLNQAVSAAGGPPVYAVSLLAAEGDGPPAPTEFLDAVAAPVAENPSSTEPTVDVSNSSQLDRALVKAVSLHFTGAPLSKVLEHVATEHHVDIALSSSVLEAADVSGDTPVTVNVDGIRLGKALDLLLTPLQLTYRTAQGIVEIEVLPGVEPTVAQPPTPVAPPQLEAEGIARTPEQQQRAELVRAVYRDLMDREPTERELRDFVESPHPINRALLGLGEMLRDEAGQREHNIGRWLRAVGNGDPRATLKSLRQQHDQHMVRLWDSDSDARPAETRQEFIQRLTTDLLGRAATAAEVAAFAASSEPDELVRQKLVDELLATQEFKDRVVNDWMTGAKREFPHWIDTRPQSPWEAGHLESRSAPENRIFHQLKEPADFEFIDTELSQVISFLSERYEIPIRSDEAALTELGVGLDTQVNLVVSRISLENALNLILRPLQLDYVQRDDVLHITTLAAAEAMLEPRVYTLEGLPGFTSEEVARAVTKTVRPGSWVVTPESPAGVRQEGPAIDALPTCIVVTHCQRAHREIVDLLEQLSRAGGAAGRP